jgi:hypothetical protein
VLGICDDGDMHAGKGGESRSFQRGARPHDSSVFKACRWSWKWGLLYFELRPLSSNEMLRLAAALSCVMLASAFAPSVLPRAHVCPLDPRGLRIASYTCMHACVPAAQLFARRAGDCEGNKLRCSAAAAHARSFFGHTHVK